MKKLVTLSLFVALSAGLKAAVFTSITSGPFSSASTWSFTGSDANGIPDNDDQVTIAGTHTVTLTSSSNAQTLTINPTGQIDLNTFSMLVWGSFTNNGSSTGAGTWQFRAPGTYSGNALNNTGSIYFYSTYTIAAGTAFFKGGSILIGSSCSITNNRSINLSPGTLHFSTGSTWTNNTGSSLSITQDITGTGTLNCSASGNTFTYQSNNYSSVYTTGATYYNLVLSSTTAQTKTLTGNLTVLNNLTLNTGVTLNWGGFNINLGRNWNNTANTQCTGMGTITFTGSGTQMINRASTERFRNVTLSGTGTVQLACDLMASGNTTLNSGTLNPSTFVYQQRGATWFGNGGACSLAATGRVAFVGTTNQTIDGTVGTTFGNLEINAPGFTVSLTIDQTGAGTTTLTAGTLDPGSFIFHQSGASWMANGGTINTSAAGEIQFNGTVAQTIDGTTGTPFGNLEIFSTGTVSLARDLDVSGTLLITSGTLDVSPSLFNVNLSGNFTHNGGSFTERTGTVFFNGASAQVSGGSSTTTFYNVTSNNTVGGVAVTGIIIIDNILQVNSRDFGTSGFGNIILTATAATTCARIGPLGVGASLSGTNWSIQSFIDGPATAYWQYMGSPTTSSTIADWDNDPRFYMSAVGGNDGTACCPTFFSVRTYNTASNTYSNVTSTSTALTPGRGFMVWMSDNMTGLTAPLVYDTKGTPNQGTVLRAVTAGGAGAGYNLVSNPYACPVDFASVVASSGNLNSSFLILQENGSYVTDPNGGVIAANQGFMCVATSSGNMKFLESNKNVVANPNIIRTSSQENYLRIRSSNSINGLGGETVIRIRPEAHNGFDLEYDLPFLASPYDDATNLWTIDRDGKDLLLNALDGNSDKLDIPLVVVSGTTGEQSLSFRGLNGFTSYTCATLEDLTTGNMIDLKNHDTYSFNAEAVGEKHNFVIHLERTGICPLSEQNLIPSLDASSQVFVNNGNILVKFTYEEMTDVNVTVLDVLGKEVAAPKNFTVSNETISLENPGAHGIYLVRITKGDEVVTKKIYL